MSEGLRLAIANDDQHARSRNIQLVGVAHVAIDGTLAAFALDRL